MRMVSPISMVPASGRTSPVIMRSMVDFPQPFGPMIPTLWLRRKMYSKSFISVLSPKALLTLWNSIVFFPMRVSTASISTTASAVGAVPFLSASRRSSRARCFVLLARQPRFAHSSSMRRMLWRFRSEASFISSRSAFSSRKRE